ncbi:MAG: tetratricopeptide repeat protein [Candidatus Sericytochromatia bacterium]
MLETLEDQARALCAQAEDCLRRARKLEDQIPLVRQALDLYRQALELDAELPDPWLGLAYLIFSAGQKDRALAILKSAQKTFPGDRRLIQLQLRLQRAQVPEQGEARPIGRLQSLRSLIEVDEEGEFDENDDEYEDDEDYEEDDEEDYEEDEDDEEDDSFDLSLDI